MNSGSCSQISSSCNCPNSYFRITLHMQKEYCIIPHWKIFIDAMARLFAQGRVILGISFALMIQIILSLKLKCAAI